MNFCFMLCFSAKKMRTIYRCKITQPHRRKKLTELNIWEIQRESYFDPPWATSHLLLFLNCSLFILPTRGIQYFNGQGANVRQSIFHGFGASNFQLRFLPMQNVQRPFSTNKFFNFNTSLVRYFKRNASYAWNLTCISKQSTANLAQKWI